MFVQSSFRFQVVLVCQVKSLLAVYVHIAQGPPFHVFSASCPLSEDLTVLCVGDEFRPSTLHHATVSLLNKCSYLSPYMLILPLLNKFMLQRAYNKSARSSPIVIPGRGLDAAKRRFLACKTRVLGEAVGVHPACFRSRLRQSSGTCSKEYVFQPKHHSHQHRQFQVLTLPRDFLAEA
jgi:hypothetical protein